VKRLAAVLALSTLAAATVGLAQQSTQQTQPPASQAAPPPEASTSSQATSPSDPAAGKASKQSLMKDCMSQVQAANPNVSVKTIQAYCEDQVQKLTSKPE
jgi:ABC-type glycerol-3-phosphate transport system substrate-binding protein